MKGSLDITDLSISCNDDGSSKMTVWAKCFTADDIDDVIAWLGLAKAMMKRWEAIRADEAAP
jgi:hypothetical protein